MDYSCWRADCSGGRRGVGNEPRVERRFDLAAVALEHRTLTVRASSAQTASGVTRWSNKWIVGPATGSTKAE